MDQLTARRKERLDLRVNDIFGLPADVKEALWKDLRASAEKDSLPRSFTRWAKGLLKDLGYKECRPIEYEKREMYFKLGDMEYKFLVEEKE